jgi:glycosyltransferase involved in cell wall biosynthesis
MIFETIGPYNAIGKIAMAQVEAALNAGWHVSVVAKRLCESLQGRVEWLKLYVPPRGFALQWLTARRFILQALGDRSRFDVIHGHQPQIADLCDVFQCHFLTRGAHETNCLLDMHGWRRGVESVQKHAVLLAEDRYYRSWNPTTHMLFNSALTREWFGRYYPAPPSQEVFLYPSPAWDPVSAGERDESRRELGVDSNGIVAGFLGGLHERKGYDRIIRELRGERDITLLMGGAHSEGFDAPELTGHFRSIGMVQNTRRFYAACDVLLLASHFEPFGYVASEAAARGVPAIATDRVGALPHLLEHAAGLEWKADSKLAPLIRIVTKSPGRFCEGCEEFTLTLSREQHDRHLLELWAEKSGQARGRINSTAVVTA